MNVGSIIIDAKINDEDLKKGLQESRKELNKFERESEQLTKQKIKYETELQGLDELLDKESQAKEVLKEYEAEVKRIDDIFFKLARNEGYLPTGRLEELDAKRDELIEKIEQEKRAIGATDKELEKVYVRYGEINEILDEIDQKTLANADSQKLVKNQIEEINGKLRQQENLKGLSNSMKQVGNEIKGNIKNVARWGLAIIGIRRAITIVTRSFSTLAEYSDELSNKMSNIRLVFAVAFENIINKIIHMIVVLLNYMNYLSKAWFGVDLFARASELSTKKMAKNMAAGAGSAKEMRKQLAGFDEMNVLSDNVAQAGGGGGLDTSNLGFNLDQDVPIPKWLEWIKDNGNLIKTILIGIGAAIAAIKLAPLLNAILTGVSTLESFTAGLALMSAGLVLVGLNVFDLIKNWDEMDTKTKVLEIALAALGAAMIAFGYAVAAGFSAATLGIGAVIAVVITLTAAMAGLIAKDVEEQKALRDSTYYQKQYNQAKKDAEKAVNEYVRAEDDAIESQRKLDEVQKKTGISGKALYDQVMDGTLKYADMTDKQKEVFKAFMDNKTAQDNLTSATKKMNKEVLNSQLQAALAEKDYKKYGDTLKKGMEEGIVNSDKMSKQLVNDMKGMDDQAKLTFVESLPKEIKDAFDWDKYGPKLKTFKNSWNAYIKELNKSIEIKATAQFQLMTGQKKGVYKKGGVVPIPKLASGAILNQPGRGVMIGRGTAIAGEAGAEGVIPLTDSQQMALLGEAIGRYITINANIINEMNGKVISRELQRVQNNDDFVANR